MLVRSRLRATPAKPAVRLLFFSFRWRSQCWTALPGYHHSPSEQAVMLGPGTLMPPWRVFLDTQQAKEGYLFMGL
jgi:hypothetical protein